MLKTINEEFLILSTFLKLKEDIRKCEPYDGYTHEDQLDYFIKQNGYNPINKYEEIHEYILDTYIRNTNLESDFFNLKESFRTKEGKSYLERFEDMSLSKENNDGLLLNVLVDIYFKLRY